ncbi:S-adenosyl-L-methionine-dependent methyltransferase [Hyaloscypha variabilis]
MPSRKKLRVHEKITLKLYKGKNDTIKPDTTQHELIFLSGVILRRNSDFEGKLPKKLNELYFVHQKKIIDGEIIDDSLEELEIKEVLKVRELVRMNKRWEPRLGARTLLKMKRKFIPRRELSTLTELYCTPGEYILPSILRLAWRGKTVEGRDGDQVQESSTSGSRKTDQDRISSVISRYTFGDMYCGAGGATCGAEMAGLQIRYGLNSDTDTGLRETPKTTPSEKDVSKRTQIFFTGALLQKGTPRIAILEETAGLLDVRHGRAFNYRTRLVILAACPGEPLPQFPKFTHSANPDLDGLKPYRTPCSVLRSIPVGCDNHELTERQIKPQKNNIYEKWNPHQIVPCITCNGEACTSHPSGKRGMTRRETAALQGFPHWFTFHGTELRVQIGNAVPPSIAKIVFKTVRKHLETVDGIIEGSEDEGMDDEETEPDGPDHECVADRELEAEAAQLEGTESEESEETELEETED